MTSARKKAAETMARIDVVIEVLDARVPESGSNPLIRELRLHRQRPCLKVLNNSGIMEIIYYEVYKRIKAGGKEEEKENEIWGLAEKKGIKIRRYTGNIYI